MSLSPSAQKICDVAVKHFARFGYDASSLAAIAEGAGMRKPSLYAHFAGKDALFLQVLEIALDEEKMVARTSLAAQGGPSDVPGDGYLSGLQERYDGSPHFQFLLRTVYAPPVALREQIIEKYRGYESELRSAFMEGLEPSLAEDRANLLTEAFLGVVDSLQVELIYNSPQTFEVRRDAMCRMLGAFAAASAQPGS